MSDRWDPTWGTLTVANPGELMYRLDQAVNSLNAAAEAAQYQNAGGVHVSSPLAEMIGGLSQAVSSLAAYIEEQKAKIE